MEFVDMLFELYWPVAVFHFLAGLLVAPVLWSWAFGLMDAFSKWRDRRGGRVPVRYPRPM